MKKIIKRFVACYTALSIGLFGTVSGMLYRQTLLQARSSLNQLLNQLETRVENARKMYEDRMKLIETEYINRAETIAYMLEHNNASADAANMEQIKNLMHVEKINIVDPNGVICISANPAAVGTNIATKPGAEDLYDLAAGSRLKPLVSLGKYNDQGIREKDYIACKLSNSKFSAIQITFYAEEVDEALADTSITNIVTNFASDYSVTISVLGMDGSKIAISQNNPDRIDVRGYDTNEERLEVLREATNGKFMNQDGKFGYLVSRFKDGYILSGHYNISSEIKLFKSTAMLLFLSMVTSGLIIVLLMRYFFRKYLFDDFESMSEDIDAFLSGDVDRNIRPINNEELEHLNRSVRMMREGYRHKSDRLNKIIGGVDTNVAAFECLDYTNSVFISDNMQRILGISDERVILLKSSVREFKLFMDSLEKKKNEDDILSYNDKWIKLSSYKLEQEYFGMIVDKTKEYEEKQDTLDQLNSVKHLSQTDALTGLFNRSGFEEKVTALLNKNCSGVMLMLDLDNFKKINDTMGHPEGDLALQTVARLLSKAFRSSDMLGRLGGDEFIAFMPNTVPANILSRKLQDILEEMREGLEKYKKHNVSISIGVAFAGEQLNDYTALYEASDTALYIAKQSGKNQYYVNSEGIRCMRKECVHCRQNCPRRSILDL